MKLQLTLIFVSASIFGFTLTNCTSEEKATLQAKTTAAHQTETVAADPSKAAPSSSTPSAQEPAWKDMNHDQRVKYMREEVLPKMRQTFAAFNSERFGRINCKTCHGDGATNESFEMPNPKLPKLPTTTEGFQALMAKEPEMMNFMMHKVKPQMAELLGMTPSDPKTNPDGFGCFNCHTAKK